MYSIELFDLYADQLQQEVLSKIEEICEEFRLEDHFGTISFSIHEFLDEIIKNASSAFSQTDISFYISSNELSMLVHHSQSLSELREKIEHTEMKPENPAFAMVSLVDEIVFSNQDQDVSLLFHVKPKMNRVGEWSKAVSKNLLTEEEIEEESKKAKNNL